MYGIGSGSPVATPGATALRGEAARRAEARCVRRVRATGAGPIRLLPDRGREIGMKWNRRAHPTARGHALRIECRRDTRSAFLRDWHGQRRALPQPAFGTLRQFGHVAVD